MHQGDHYTYPTIILSLRRNFSIQLDANTSQHKPFLIKFYYLFVLIIVLFQFSNENVLAKNNTLDRKNLLSSNDIKIYKQSISKQEVLPTFNLSYLLKRPETKRQAWEDMKMLRDKIKETIET